MLFAEALHLGWEHLHGGILTHHFLRSAAMPGFFNGWGLVVLPALGAWAGWRIERRLALGARPVSVWAAGALALALGLALATAFTLGREDLSGAVFFGSCVLAVVLPACRAEVWLGFVLGMAFTFGAVIATVVGGVITGASALIHLVILPALGWIWRRIRVARGNAAGNAAGNDNGLQ
jgi:hypothetical protein